MTNKPRIRQTAAPLRANVRVASTHEDWHKLMTKAIELAEKSSDRRLPGLRDALANNRTEPHLRKLGIVCPADLVREFPIPTP